MLVLLMAYFPFSFDLVVEARRKASLATKNPHGVSCKVHNKQKFHLRDVICELVF